MHNSDVRSKEKIFIYIQDVTAPERKTVHVTTSNLRQTGLLLDRKRNDSKCQVLTKEKLNEISARLEYSPRKFI
jgi:hypothetical protein